MSQLIYGKNGQVHFDSEEDKQIAIDYILNSPNVDFNIHEDNQNQGAWGAEERIHFKERADIPQCLLDIMTVGKSGIYGRINCGEFCKELRNIARNR